MGNTRKSKDNDIKILLNGMETPDIVREMASLTKGSQKLAIEEIKEQGWDARHILKELSRSVLDHAENPDSIYYDLIGHHVLARFAEIYLDYSPDFKDKKTLEPSFMFFPENYLEDLKRTLKAISDRTDETPEIVEQKINGLLDNYKFFIERKYEGSLTKEQTVEKEERAHMPWSRFTNELLELTQVITDSPLFRYNSELVYKIYLTLESLTTGSDPVPQSSLKSVKQMMQAKIFTKAAEAIKESKEIKKQISEVCEKEYPITLTSFCEIFNRASKYAKEYERLENPYSSATIGKLMTDFTRTCLVHFASELSDEYNTDKGRSDAERKTDALCKAIACDEEMRLHFVTNLAHGGADMKLIARATQKLTL